MKHKKKLMNYDMRKSILIQAHISQHKSKPIYRNIKKNTKIYTTATPAHISTKKTQQTRNQRVTYHLFYYYYE